MNSSVCAIVVAYGARSELEACVESLVQNEVGEIVIVDNLSRTPLLDCEARGDVVIRRVASGSNLGYGRAVNYAASMTARETLLICNPDIVVGLGAASAMVKGLEDSKVAIVAPKILNPDGTRYPSFREFPSLYASAIHGILGPFFPENPVSQRYRAVLKDPTSRVAVPWVSGACMALRRDTFIQLGGFDPQYFLYCEDVDICHRAKQLGMGVLYEPQAEVIHFQGSSTASRPLRSLYEHHRALWVYARSTIPPGPRLALSAVGIWTRFSITLALSRMRNRGEAG